MSSELNRAKKVFYEFFNGVAGLRFTKREDFDTVVDALVSAAAAEQSAPPKGHVVATCECEICSIMRRLPKEECPYCKKEHDPRLACKEYSIFLEQQRGMQGPPPTG